ncbi:hypothetical protein BDK51DRAFT_25293, partial [Blyttiomyces helicus]
MTLNSFHLSGTGNKTVTTGIPRLKELINAVKNLKTPGMTISLLDPFRFDKKSANRIRARFEHASLSDLLESLEIFYDKDYRDSSITIDRPWMDAMNQIPDEDAPEANILQPWVLRMVFCREKLSERDLSMDLISQKLLTLFGNDVFVFHSDDNHESLVLHLRIFKDDDEFVNDLEFDEEASCQRFLDAVTIDMINSITICGVPGIKSAFISEKQCTYYDHEGKLSSKTEYIIETDGINLKDSLHIPGIDKSNLYCNDPQEMFSM